MVNCPECDGPVEFDKDSGKFYCPKCEKLWEPSEVEKKETIEHIYREH